MRFLYLLLTLLYVLNPYDIFPDIIPYLGWIDDIILLFFLFRYFSRFNPEEKSSLSNFQKKKNPFNILGVKAYSDSNTIRTAYRNLVKQYHPDKVTHMDHEHRKLAKKRFFEINEAYEQLKKLGKIY